MTKRIVATFLWFYSGLLVGSMTVVVLSVPTVVAPALGLAAATFVALDPLGLFWTRSTKVVPPTVAASPQRESRRAA